MAKLPDLVRRFRWGLVALFAAGLLAHAWFWYAPRERAASPDESDVPAALLRDPRLPVALWLPYPHQNLGALARSTSGTAEWLAAAGRFADVETPKVPGFGPFRAPPARELTVAADPEGHRFVMAARVFPAIAVVARLAGWVAGNPWLGGGEVQVSGRPAHVGWHGTLWWAASDPDLVPAGAESASVAAALAILRSGAQRGFLPAGTYRVERAGAALVFVGDQPASATSLPSLAGGSPDLLLASSGDATGRLERGAFLLWASAGGQELSLPGLAALRNPGSHGWKLPGAGAAALFGGMRDRPVPGGFVVTALDAQSGERAAALAPVLGTWLDPATDAAPVLAARIELAAAARELHRLNGALAAIPLLSRRETERWRDAEKLLAPFAAAGRLDLVVTRAPGGVRGRIGPPEN